MSLATEEWKNKVFNKALKPLGLVIAVLFCCSLFMVLGLLLGSLYLLFFLVWFITLGHIDWIKELNKLVEGDMGKSLLRLVVWTITIGVEDDSK